MKIKTHQQYLIALERFEKIFQAKLGTKEGNEAEVLSLTLKEYEDQRYVIEQYNQEIEEAMQRIDKGELTTHEDVEKEMGSW